MNDDPTKDYYTTYADEYFSATYTANLQPLWDRLSKRLERGDYILDLGCGSGRDMKLFAELGFRVIGIDYSPSLVKLAEAFSGQPVVLGDFASLPFEKDTFDGVWSIGSLVHVPRSLVSSVLSEVHRVLKEGGVLLTSVKEGTGDEIDSLGRYNTFYSSDEWKDIHLKSGYEMIELDNMVEIRESEFGGTKRIVWLVSIAKKVSG